MATSNGEHIELSPPGSCLRHLSLNNTPTEQDTQNDPATLLFRGALHRNVAAFHLPMNPGVDSPNSDYASEISWVPSVEGANDATADAALARQVFLADGHPGMDNSQSQGQIGSLTTGGSHSPSNPASAASGASLATPKRGSPTSPGGSAHFHSPMDHETRVRIRDRQNRGTPPTPTPSSRSIADRHGGEVGGRDVRDIGGRDVTYIGTQFAQVSHDVVVEDTEWSECAEASPRAA